MTRNITPQQMEAWVAKLQSNMKKFLETDDLSPEERIAFIRHQYALLDIIVKALKGKVYFSGCPQPHRN